MDPKITNTLIQEICTIVSARYIFPEVADSIVAFLDRQCLDGIYAACSSPDDLAERITSDLRRTANDEHLRVRYFAEQHKPEAEGETVREQNDRQAHVETISFGISRIEFLDDNVGYIDIRELVEHARSAEYITAAMTLLSKSKALIIDLRKCCGGDPATVAWLCSYFFNARTELSALHLRESASMVQFHTQDWVPGQRFGEGKPIYVLLAHYTFSGAEMLAYDLQARGRAIVVGETSGGGAHACNFYWPTPHFSLLLPEARPINPVTQSNWEKLGVQPDIPVNADDALSTAHRLARKHITQGLA
jgi:C-terminal processing protease CtpA/Prc